MAGPGTGKTYSLMGQVRALLASGANPERILLVTFTRTAAEDLKESLQKLGVSGVERIRSGTLHSFCLDVLHKASFFLQTGREPRILLKYETRFLLEDLKDLGLGVRDLGKLLNAFEALWAREQDQEPGWASDGIERQFERALAFWLRFHKAMLLSEIIPETLSYLRDNPLSDARSSFDHVLVDEYQDLNRAEQSLIDLLSETATLTVVGDEDQSIYQHFRFAHPEGIAQFHSTHPGTHDISLSECRRCPQIVVNMANALISHNNFRDPRTLAIRSGNENGEVKVVQWGSIEAEAEGLAEFIHKRIETGEFDPGEVLVLCPRREFGYAIRDALIQRGRDAVSFFQEEVFDGTPTDLAKSKSQQAFTLLRLLENRRDLVALRCWLGFGHDTLHAKQYSRLREHCYHNNIHPFDALAQVVEGRLELTGIDGIIRRYELLCECLAETEGKPVNQVFTEIFPVSEEWATPFHEMVGEIGDQTSLKELVRRLQSEIAQPELPTNVPYIRVMSLHKSKGLSADHVIVAGFIEGLIPHQPDDDMSDHEREHYIEEQRRLFYVAITRARKTLILSSVTSLPRKLAFRMRVRVTGGNRENGNTITSTFLRELGSACPRAIAGKDLR